MTLTRSQVRDLLERHQLGPSRALGQNFLCDKGMVDKIVRLADVGPGDRVVEIGPGLGSLTAPLCQTGARVVAIEIDRYLLAPLREVVGHFEDRGQLSIVNADVTTVDWEEILGPATGQQAGDDWSVVANLPYNIATPLILDLLATQPRLQNWVIMVQKEAGQRLVAGPGSKVYGIPSVLVAYWASARLAGSVPAELFHPRPRVESVLVVMERHRRPVVDVPFERLAGLVRSGFGQRRKMLRRSLASHLSTRQIEQAGVDPTARPEQLSLEEWARLAAEAR